jgi:hypothetical protein
MIETSEIEITFHEDGAHTEARASLTLRGVTFDGWGRARRSPGDADVPLVGEELAVARALSDLAHKLVEAAAEGVDDHRGGAAPVGT